MRIELRVARGARAGHRQTFDADVVTLGRDASSDLRLDPERDLDVSTRHAELRRVDGEWRIRDSTSRNGTFVNDERIAAERALRDGDVIALGREGPRLEVRLVRPAGAPPPTRASRGSTMVRIERAVRARTGTLRRALIGVTAILLIAVAAAFLAGRRGVAERDARLTALLARNDSLGARLEREIAALSGRLTGLDAALAESKRESDALRRELERERSRASTATLEQLASRLEAAESRRIAIASAAQTDHAAVASASGPAVVLIAVEMPDGSRHTGTGFSVTDDGIVVTNRHVVRDSSGAAPRRVAVIFPGTRRWLEARVQRVSQEAEIALLQVAVPGRYPAVGGIGDASSALTVGAPVTVIGYPLGLETPMGADRASFTAHASLGVGTVSKVLPDLIQIDAWAGQGSSGSPVFGADGRVVAVVFGGARESGGRIVYAVPGEQVRRLLGWD